jgi:fatty acid synthase
MFYRDIANGIVKPLKTTVFPAAEIEQAFRFLAGGKHIGKVLLQMRDNETDEYLVPASSLIYSRVNCNPKLSYVSYFGHDQIELIFKFLESVVKISRQIF